MFVVAFAVMKDLGFTPERSRHPLRDVKRVFSASIDHGLRNPPVRWVMLAAPFSAGVGIYAFYALQPYLLELYGDETGLQRRRAGGGDRRRRADSRRLPGAADPRPFRPPHVGADRRHGGKRPAARRPGPDDRASRSRSSSLVLWGLVFAAVMPIRQAYLNGMIPSEQRATVLSFDSLMGNTGGVVIQPALGRAADVWSYGTSYVIGAGIQALAVPFLLLSRRENCSGGHCRRTPRDAGGSECRVMHSSQEEAAGSARASPASLQAPAGT